MAAASEQEAKEQARISQHLFTHYGWEEHCELNDIHPIPRRYYNVVVEYMTDITKDLHRRYGDLEF